MDKIFGNCLKEARKRRGMSQSALARALDMNASHINRIERGFREPPKREKVIKIINALGMTPEDGDTLLLSAGYAGLSSNVRVQMDDGIRGTNLSKATRTDKRAHELVSRDVKDLVGRIETTLIDILSNSELGSEEQKAIRQAVAAVPAFIHEFARTIISGHLKSSGQTVENIQMHQRFLFQRRAKVHSEEATSAFEIYNLKDITPRIERAKDEPIQLMRKELKHFEESYWASHPQR